MSNILEKLDFLNNEYNINMLNLNKVYKTHYFKHNNIIKPKLEITSFEDINLSCYTNNYMNIHNNIKETDNIHTMLKKITFNCRHIFHDDKWLKVSDNDFFNNNSDDDDDVDVNKEKYKYILTNSINLDDLYKPEIIDFLNNLKIYQNKYNFIVKEISNIDEDEEEDETINILWIVLYLS